MESIGKYWQDLASSGKIWKDLERFGKARQGKSESSESSESSERLESSAILYSTARPSKSQVTLEYNVGRQKHILTAEHI